MWFVCNLQYNTPCKNCKLVFAKGSTLPPLLSWVLLDMPEFIRKGRFGQNVLTVSFQGRGWMWSRGIWRFAHSRGWESRFNNVHYLWGLPETLKCHIWADHVMEFFSIEGLTFWQTNEECGEACHKLYSTREGLELISLTTIGMLLERRKTVSWELVSIFTTWRAKLGQLKLHFQWNICMCHEKNLHRSDLSNTNGLLWLKLFWCVLFYKTTV